MTVVIYEEILADLVDDLAFTQNVFTTVDKDRERS
jgi:hypothetical protein